MCNYKLINISVLFVVLDMDLLYMQHSNCYLSEPHVLLGWCNRTVLRSPTAGHLTGSTVALGPL